MGNPVGYVAESVVMGGSGWRSGRPCVSISLLSKENIVADGDRVNWVAWCSDGCSWRVKVGLDGSPVNMQNWELLEYRGT